jgi:hypothetical protein
MSIELLQAHYGFGRMPFGRDLAPQMLHRSHGHNEAVARIHHCVHETGLGVITGEVGSGKTVATRAATSALDASRNTLIYVGTLPLEPAGSTTASSPRSAVSPDSTKPPSSLKPLICSPPKRTNAANVSSSPSTKPTSSPPTSWKRSGS